MENARFLTAAVAAALFLIIVLALNGRALRMSTSPAGLAENVKMRQVLMEVNVGALYPSTPKPNQTAAAAGRPPGGAPAAAPVPPKGPAPRFSAPTKGLIDNIQKFDWQANRDPLQKAPHVMKAINIRRLAKNRDPSLHFLFGVQLPVGEGKHASELVVMNSSGHVIASKAFPGQRIWLAAFANSTTIYGLATASDTDWDWNTTAHFVLYNFQTGHRVNVPLEGGTHWLEYDVHTQSLVWLKNRFVQVNCNRVDHTKAPRKQAKPALSCPPAFIFAKVRHTHVVTDDIIEMNLKGRTTFHWDVLERLTRVSKPSSPFKFQPMPMRKWRGKSRGHPDYVHANCVFRDPQEDVVYLNSLSLSSLLKIRRRTRELVWVVGMHSSNYKMYDENGEELETLFKLAHSVNYLGDNRFLIFDNAGATVSGAPGSRLIIFYVNETNKTVHIQWQWKPETSFDNVQLTRGNGGGTHPLLDGGVIGAFGEPWTQYLVEVNGKERTMDVEVQNAFIQDVTAFYHQPVVKLARADATTAVLHCHNAFRELRFTTAWLQVHALCPAVAAAHPVRRQTVHLRPFWQATPVEVSLPAGAVAFVLENADGLKGHHRLERPCP
eukprot:EG_transcript_5822